MKIYSRLGKILFWILTVVLLLAVVVLLVRWTRSIEASQRRSDLKAAMQEVVKEYGEKGLLEMAGVQVNDIYYGDDGVSLLEGQSWKYSSDELVNITVFEKCQAAVVHISTVTDTSAASVLDVSTKTGVGSGFFISYDGYICTNLHVVKDASEIKVMTSDGGEYDATLVGTDSENDLAVLKVEPPEENKTFSYLEWGDSDSLVVGQKVLAIGNPFGYDRSMVTGIISGLSRPIRDEKGQVLLGMIQTDAPINPGNSGGPLLDTQGKVIGINAAIYSSNGVNEGMNFAVASNTAKESTLDIRKYGKINRGWIDIVPVQITPEIAKYAKLNTQKGILVSQTAPLGKADRSGLRGGTNQVHYGNSIIYIGGDVITKINGYEVSEYSDLFTALSTTRPGDKVDVEIERDGKAMTLKVELAERTAENVGWINR